MKKKRIALIVVTMLGAGMVALYAKYRQVYPYGATHCCNKGIFFDLLGWAEEHDGKFPDEGSTAATFAMLSGGNDNLLRELAGKSIDPDAAVAYYRVHHTLSPELCSWAYVPGLTETSPPGMLLFWDTTGLSHNGMEQHPKRYEIVTVDGSASVIPEAAWPVFLERQRQLRADAGLPVSDVLR